MKNSTVTRYCLNRALRLCLLIATGAMANNVYAEQPQGASVIELQSTIVGNKEQPEVIYIVPWQALNAQAPQYRPVQSLVEEQIQLLDRDEWRRRTALSTLLNVTGENPQK